MILKLAWEYFLQSRDSQNGRAAHVIQQKRFVILCNVQNSTEFKNCGLLKILLTKI